MFDRLVVLEGCAPDALVLVAS
eukprot:COSAG04_NODE_23786_length_332_cov_0.686695_1_plen_21_part_01